MPSGSEANSKRRPLARFCVRRAGVGRSGVGQRDVARAGAAWLGVAWLCVAWFCVAWCAAACPSAGLPADLSELLQRQSQAIGPIQIQWRDDGQVCQTRWQGGCVYCSSGTKPVGADGAADMYAVSFNRDLIFWSFENEGRTVLHRMPIPKPGDRRRATHWFQCDYLRAACWELPSSADELGRPAVQSSILKLIGGGARVDQGQDCTIDGRAVRRVDLLSSRGGRSRRDAFFLDARLADAIVRRQEYFNDSLVRQTDNADFEELAGRGIWLPRRSVIREGGRSREITVDAISTAAIATDQFVLHADDVGDLISDEGLAGGRIDFQIPPAPATLDLASLPPPEGASAESTRPRIWIGAAVAVLAGSWISWRRRVTIIQWIR